jgi:hypothetical protein
MNSLFVIVPYKYEGMWVFDDPSVGLSREPFIAGIDTMIDRLVAKIPDAERGFRAIFGAAPFPGHTERLDWRREESGGNWYYNDRFEMEGWLCPALFKYFAAAPKTIYVQVEPASKRLFVRVSVPTAAGSRTTFSVAVVLRGRPRRAFVEPTRRAAVSLRGR